MDFQELSVMVKFLKASFLFFPGQLSCIINLDKSGLTLNGNGMQPRGWPSTVHGSMDEANGCGADRANKRSSQISLVAGSSAAGFQLPLHFQLKSNAMEDEKKKIQELIFNGVQNTKGVFVQWKLYDKQLS